ncbi:site-specific tyrosine recombinase [Burkholderia vietnamiensis]|nr:site-specific tyrosine recombinase [Burkholderia vietnamiensis]
MRRSPASMRPRSGCSCSARPIRAASTTAWPPTSSRRSRRSRAPRSRACCRTDTAPMLDDPIAAYLSNLKHVRQLSEHTLRGYTHELDELKKLAAGRPLETLTATDVRGAVARAHAGGLSARSISHRLSAWRAFYRWLALRIEMPANPVAAVRAPKRPKTLPKALSVDDASALMDAPLPDTTEGIRDHAILELFYSSGLRLAELVGLDAMYTQADGYRSAGWLDLAEAEVTVRGKGNKERKVPVGRKAIAALNAWLAVRGEFVKHDPHPLFLSVRGNRMAPGVVRERVKRAALSAGIPANVHPHVLRHSFATHVLQSSGDLRAVQELLGHASVAATQIYTSLDFQHLAKIYDSAHPRAKKRD